MKYLEQVELVLFCRDCELFCVLHRESVLWLFPSSHNTPTPQSPGDLRQGFKFDFVLSLWGLSFILRAVHFVLRLGKTVPAWKNRLERRKALARASELTFVNFTIGERVKLLQKVKKTGSIGDYDRGTDQRRGASRSVDSFEKRSLLCHQTCLHSRSTRCKCSPSQGELGEEREGAEADREEMEEEDRGVEDDQEEVEQPKPKRARKKSANGTRVSSGPVAASAPAVLTAPLAVRDDFRPGTTA